MNFRVKGIKVEISFWFIAVIALMIIVFPSSKGFFCFFFCVLHEIGHLTAMSVFRKKPLSISLGYFGIKIVTGGRYLSCFAEIIIAFAGPLINLIIFAFLLRMKQKELADISLSLAVFNLLPVQILDGGRILTLILNPNFPIKRIGFIISVIVLVIGIAVAIYSKNNYTILFASIYLLTANFCE